ncbi:MAG: response regulator transcription factor [Chloroflexota bacterium]|nr:response regulator transcription factor [Chloroflexota bacterium]
MAAPIRVLLVEDHDLVRAGIRSLLQNLTGIEVVAEAGTGREASRLVEIHCPDVALMDIALPDSNGLDVAAGIIKQFPQTRVIILSMHSNEEYVWQALHAGASGYLLKNSSTSELEVAIHAVARGESYLSPPASTHLVHDFTRRARGEPSSIEALTLRQREVLGLIARGYSTQQIANELTVSPKTVETHRRQLMQRLELYDIASLVRYAIHAGLLLPGE